MIAGRSRRFDPRERRDSVSRWLRSNAQNGTNRPSTRPTRACSTELQGDARLTNAELGRRVSLSPPAVAERLRRLERDGVITGYRAEVDPKALGYTLERDHARSGPTARQLPKVADLANDTPELVWCHRITGEDCFILELHVESVQHLQSIIDRFLLFGQTTTSIIQSSPVRGRGPVGCVGLRRDVARVPHAARARRPDADRPARPDRPRRRADAAREARVPEPGRLEQGPDRDGDDRGRRARGEAASRAARSSSRPPATPASAWRSRPPRAATAASS